MARSGIAKQMRQLQVAKSEHAHPIRSGQIHPLEAKNGMKTALKNGAYPFKIV